MAPATRACARRVRIVQNGKNLLWRCPILDIDLFAYNTALRRKQCFVLTSACTKFTLAVLRDIDMQNCSPEMRGIAKEIDGTFLIPALQFAVGGTHSTKRLDAAFDTFGDARALSRSNIA